MKKLLITVVSLAAAFAQAKPSFFMPEKLYAVAGVPCNVYYARLLDSYTPQNYMLEGISPVGHAYETCWSFTPKAEDAGKSFPLVLNAWSDADGLVASATTTVVVAQAPTEAQKARKITMGLLSASSTNCRYQDQIYVRMREAGFAAYTPVGSRTPPGKPGDTAFHVPHDGYGGFAWEDFRVRYAMTVDEIDNIQSEAEREQLKSFGVKLAPGNEWRKGLLKSPLVRPVNGKRTVDVQAWFDKVNGGEAPDYIFITLGGNGVWAQRPDTKPGVVEKQVEDAKLLLPYLRKAAPKTVIVITTAAGGSFDQDSYGNNYGAIQHCMMTHRATLDYDRAMQKLCEESGDPLLVFAPVSHGTDPYGAYPRGRARGNALHATLEGGKQFGDTIFAWLLNDVTTRF